MQLKEWKRTQLTQIVLTETSSTVCCVLSCLREPLNPESPTAAQLCISLGQTEETWFHLTECLRPLLRDWGEIKFGKADPLMHDSFTAPECCGPTAESNFGRGIWMRWRYHQLNLLDSYGQLNIIRSHGRMFFIKRVTCSLHDYFRDPTKVANWFCRVWKGIATVEASYCKKNPKTF